MKTWWLLLKDAAANWSKHKDARQGAALAYYSIFSLGPLMVIAIAIAGLVFGQEAVRGELASQLRGLLGDGGAQAVQAMLAGASQPQQGILATVLGVGTLLFAAVGVVVQLKDALDTVWEVEPAKNGGIWAFVRTYVAEDRLSDPVQAAVKRTPYAATALALAAGWLLGRMRNERAAIPATPRSLDY
jgi:membrane protein